MERERNNGNNGVAIDLVYGNHSQKKKKLTGAVLLYAMGLASVKKEISKFCLVGK